MLTIYKASAGSGKTFRLVIEYLKLLLLNENNYKRILAVTFTNKATAEMKDRVISQLFEISINPEKNTYAEIICKETNLRNAELKKKAKEALRNILHDYNRFSINTIDKFTQKVIKAFNREIGITPGYILELDTDMLLQEATDRLILKVNQNKDLLKWLKELGEERIRGEKSFIIRTEITKLGQELFKEKFQDFFTADKILLYSRENLKNYQKELQLITHTFESDLKRKGIQGVTILQDNNVSIIDFSFGKSGVASVFTKVIEKQFNFGSRILDSSEDAEKWVKKSHPQKAIIISIVEQQLLPLLNEILDFYNTNFEEYISAKKILDNFYTLGVLNDLKAEIDELRQEKGILPISDSNLLLKRIIGESDSPFIYEKVGNTYLHFMLDEFQDTSGMQWDNFKPLIENSLAEGKSNLAVGDVKQSIYRWRNSNWKILGSEIETQFNTGQLKTINLQNNWRSDSNIIGFNNSIFPKLIKHISEKFDSENENNIGAEESKEALLFKKIYDDVEQKTGNDRTNKNGFAKVSFIEETEEASFKKQSLDKLLMQVKELQDNGYTGNDIAILVRRNSEGGEIIKHFLSSSEQAKNNKYNLEVISNESLFLNSSNSVLFVVQIINHIINPDDKITKANIINEYKIYLQPILIDKGKDIVYTTVNSSGQVAFNFTSQTKNTQSWQLNNSFEDDFETNFGPIIETLKTTILNASIDEAIMHICHTFNLFELEKDLPFLQGLIDQAAQIKTNISNDLSNFLKWWDDKGQKLSVNVNDNTDAMRLLTIHKSKGLEFNVVLIPFFDWDILWKGTMTPTIWCEPNQQPFNKLPLVPIKASKKMVQTIFAADYLEEKFNTYIDNLNMVYVAFTRAVSVLMVNAPYKDTKKINSVSDLLYASLTELSVSNNWQGTQNEAEKSFELGSLFQNNKRKKKSKGEQFITTKYFFNEFNSRLKLRTDSDDFFEETGMSNKNLGKLLHEILAEVTTFDDVENACQKALGQRKITNDEFEKLFEWLTELVNSAHAKDWFSGGYKVLNERNLLSGNGIKRPDRILIKGNKAIVIDYKLGDAELDKYKRQVKDYAFELKKIGFSEVDGFLWYLKPNKIQKVCSL